ncbi:hypothetical protein ZHAS_00003639 [Anopheles sinensis]|uniref:Secreted protein n=1 Tax=Anopheles sinensis TaxID=74873 RepID=A0A084VEV5_ANOSI|nr:hypothetical protein ZHAS_00003639 [Anopheles sinensis]
MLLARVTLGFLWLGLAWWTTCDSLQRNPLDTRKISNARYIVYPGRCYDHRTGINLPRRKTTKFKHFCMRATCFSNYTMLIESCLSCLAKPNLIKRPLYCLRAFALFAARFQLPADDLHGAEREVHQQLPALLSGSDMQEGQPDALSALERDRYQLPTRRPPKTGRKVKRRRKNKKGHSVMAHQEGVAGAAGGCEGNECGANVTNATEVP